MNLNYYKSPVGWLKIVTTDSAVAEIEYVDRPETQDQPIGYARQVISQLEEYFRGQRQQFSLQLTRNGPDFTFQVWRALEKIPYGQVKTYGQVAKELSRLHAARAVGNACHVNPLAIVVPCHRVVGSSPQAGGYASGQWRKDWLIKHEQR